MADLIDRAQAIKLLMGEAVGKYPQSFYFGLFAAAKELKELPAVDAVEVVRCKDCKYACLVTDHDLQCLYDDDSLVHPHSHYCSYGERRTDG